MTTKKFATAVANSAGNTKFDPASILAIIELVTKILEFIKNCKKPQLADKDSAAKLVRAEKKRLRMTAKAKPPKAIVKLMAENNFTKESDQDNLWDQIVSTAAAQPVDQLDFALI